jgi:oligosaccharide repeat unit polymerase
MNKRQIIIHPLVVLVGVWSLVMYLYSLHWSELMSVKLADGMPILLSVFAPFAYVSALFAMRRPKEVTKSGYQIQPGTEQRLTRALRIMALAWVGATLLEIVYSRGVPIEWLAIHSAKTYFDFGIPTVHGFLNALICAITSTCFLLYLRLKDRRFLFGSMFIVVWGIVAMTRQLMMVCIFQYAVIYACVRRLSLQKLVVYCCAALIVLAGFGALGDARTGAKKFESLAMPSENYPEALPSVFLWGYMYAVTPLMNLIYTRDTRDSGHDLLMLHTIAPLLPSVLRSRLIANEKNQKGNVISQAFNVSTAFVDSYTDAGLLGVMLFAFGISIPCVFYWYRYANDDYSLLIFSVLMQCLILTVFYDHFLSLPVITQTAWISVLRRVANRRV